MRTGQYPNMRMRRLRTQGWMREMVQQHRVHVSDLILPLFVEEGLDERVAIPALPGVFRETEESVVTIAKEAAARGIPAVMLFGVSHNKDAVGSDSLSESGLLYRMIDRVKQAVPEIGVIADSCFCEYTDHGHCGPLNKRGDVDNDATIEALAVQAVIAAKAGADIIAPSGMMDGMIQSMRTGLDQSGFETVPLLSYAAKYASSFYGPFREAAGCSLEHAPEGIVKDRQTYQMNPANSDEALREVAMDIAEGADMVMIKPGLPYLDIIHRIKETYKLPTFAYHVSGEYAMLRAAAQNGWMDYDAALYEVILSFKRAGCDGILSYGALDLARSLQSN